MKKAIKAIENSEVEILKLEDELAINPKEAPPRKPRAKYFGEIIQMDYSNEIWFENERSYLMLRWMIVQEKL